MVVRKAGGQNLNKKKNIEEAKKMAEKKKLMMKEEESEDEDMSDEDEMDDEDVSDETEESEEMEDTEDEDSDDEESADEEGTKKPNKSKDFGQGFMDKRGSNKTPAKTPSKAANKTPAKTPNKTVLQQNSQKKQMESKTPKAPKQQNISKPELSPSPKKTDNLKARTPLRQQQQQKGSGSTKKTIKPMELEDEDDDDEEDDDDDEEEDDEEEEEDEDDEEEEEEEEEEENEKDEKKQVSGGGDDEEEEDKEDEQPQAKKPKTDFPTVDLKDTDQERRSERDTRSLYVRGFPSGTTEEEIKALSPDIIAVRIPVKKRKVHNTGGIIFAFVEFASEKAAEENFSVIEKKKFKGKDLFVDFVGEKSKNKSLADKFSNSPKNVNKQKLFVSGIPKQATLEDIGKAFPAAISVYVNNSGANKTAQVLFANEEDAAEAFKSNSSLKMRGTQVVVLYALRAKKHKGGRGSGVGGGGRGRFSPRGKPFNQGFRKPFQNQRRSFNKQQNDDDDE